jgi:hypothetical protein
LLSANAGIKAANQAAVHSIFTGLLTMFNQYRQVLNSIVAASALCAGVEPQARRYTKLRHCLNIG